MLRKYRDGRNRKANQAWRRWSEDYFSPMLAKIGRPPDKPAETRSDQRLDRPLRADQRRLPRATRRDSGKMKGDFTVPA